MTPRLLDLFCGAGGAAMGYHRAGFEVVGVDIEPQPHYPFEFIQADVFDFLHPDQRRLDFDAAHASPPCQAYTAYKRTGRVGTHPQLIAETRMLLKGTGLSYVIENVEGAPLDNPVRICGTGLTGNLQRHRLFETNFPVMGVPCSHGRNAPNRFPGGRSKGRTGDSRGLVRGTLEVGSWDIPLAIQSLAMGINWMSLEELSEAIPPAYTEHIGGYLMAEVKRRVAA